MLKTLIANLTHAAINGETVHIGGGEFTAGEIKAALDQYNNLHAAAGLALDALEWEVGGEPLPTLCVTACESLRTILRSIV